MEYLDLSPYEYTDFPIPMRCIGWLGQEHGMQSSQNPPMDLRTYERFKSASRRLSAVMLGTHDCEFCPDDYWFEGNGEYRYYMPDGQTYAAPMMVVHYVDAHDYRLPMPFRESLMHPGELVWDWRAERLSAVLLDESADFEVRCEAIIDLTNWQDDRSLTALRRAAEDELLVDVSGHELGRSLALLSAGRGEGGRHLVDEAELPSPVREGIALALRELPGGGMRSTRH
ncbi:HEAT repeat domain-containing protein [Streptomyces sp. NRRL S-118]|jgi:hypothetical protein|uniref:HEAT repeat domain-containing protein n=1 Tax=Streptomyces sp. NRRL S-118 TaxID=1463881 RepID=UPI0006932DA7|nr:HEAT repeat domain-containing protein [Streptomyces sp. NRRL S-118]